MTPQPQFEVVFATHDPSQQLSPTAPIMGSSQAGAEPQEQTPATQSGPLVPHSVPQPPQFAVSVWVSMQAPPQQVCPEGQAAPVLPQEQTPATQISSPGQTLPMAPQLLRSVWVFTQRKVPPSLTQLSPTMHCEKVPHTHWGAPPPTAAQALARSASHSMPQPLQFMKDESERPSPVSTERFTQVVPQQRCAELQVGEQSPVTVESVVPPSVPPATHMPDLQLSPAAHSIPQPPQWSVLVWVAWQNAAPLTVEQHMSPAAHAGEHAPLPRPSSPHAVSAKPITTRKAAPARRTMKAIFDITTTPCQDARPASAPLNTGR
jgi:hypothetical protein